MYFHVFVIGFARLASDSRRDIPNPPWVLPASLSIEQLGGVFKLDWIHRYEIYIMVLMYGYL